jgi:MoxR-like ATPase
MVLATQNPIEHEGTYPLPEAQVDRFLMKLLLGYPSPNDERQVLELHNRPLPTLTRVYSPEDIIELQEMAERVFAELDIRRYILDLVQFTRRHRRVYLGCSPRAGLNLMCASKALALIRGRDFVLPDDVKLLAPHVLAHRILLTPEAELEGVSTRDILKEALETVPALPKVKR